MRKDSTIIVGGAGFIGSHFIDRLLEAGSERVRVYDNFSSGRQWHFEHHRNDPRFSVVRGEVKDLETLSEAMDGHDVVIHLASNPDIAKAATEPTVDFYEGTLLTQQVLEAMRLTATPQIMYASGSGVYGDIGETEADESFGPNMPISTYGASKLAGEALISSYSHLFGIRGCSFRFGNVVGPRQTHGVGFDFVRRLLEDPSELRILGDGSQSKSYVHVYDVVTAVLIALEKSVALYDTYNVASGDYITVREIADLTIDCLGLVPGGTTYLFTGGDRGWKGDVPIVRLKTDRIRSLGWSPQFSSRTALKASILSMLSELKEGRS